MNFLTLLGSFVVFFLCRVVSSYDGQYDGRNMTQTWKHSIRVSNTGKDCPECLQNSRIPCQHLDYVFDYVKEQSSTVIWVESVDHILNNSHTFAYVNQFAIIGVPSSIGHSPLIPVVRCEKRAGLSFIFSAEIIIKNIYFASCGAIQNSTSINNLKFYAGLFLVNCVNLTIDKVYIMDSPGIGIQLYDVSGNVSISHSHFFGNGNNTLEGFDGIIPGGGFYFEFTFMGGLYPFDTPPKRIYQENGVFHFINSSFEKNCAPRVYKHDNVTPNGKDHIAFGRGGGASFFIKGSAQNNTFIFENCYFNDNVAEWGAGIFIEFQDYTKANSFTFQLCHFTRNHASLGGGGVRSGLITMHQNNSCFPNSLNFTDCHFQHNRAILGGGIALYGTTKDSYLAFPDQSFINITKCVIEENFATVGSGLCSALWNTKEYGIGETLKIFIGGSHIKKNQLCLTEDGRVSGAGALYIQGTPLLLYNTHFTSNEKTALVLDGAMVKIIGNVSFINNTGQRGGAMSLYGRSKINVTNKANLSFIENQCSVQGGAIYVKTPGPQLVAFKTTELQLHGCFFSVTENCNCSVSFYGNKSPSSSSGHSVYATTLQYCRLSNEPRENNSALAWKSFNYYFANGTRKSDIKAEIVTEAVSMKVNSSDWNTASDKSFSPTLTLLDEKSNSVYGVIDVKVTSNQNDNVTLDPSSTYFLARDKIESLKIESKPKTTYNVSLLTVDSQLVTWQILNAEITDCAAGFVWTNADNLCTCDSTQIGVSRCDYEKQSLFLLKGYWGGYAQSTFAVVECPENYCYCNQNHLTSSGECFFVKDKQCSGNRESQLCGKCKPGFSLQIGEDKCSKDCASGSHKWIGYFVGLLLLLTLLVLVIMFINSDPFSAYLNAWLYSYQVLPILVPGYINLDPFLFFIIGLAHVRIQGLGGVCMWSGMDDLQKLALNYVLPLYVFICLCFLNKIAVLFPNNVLTRRFTQTSVARAFCTLFVLSYSTVVSVSLNILNPIQIGDEYFVYYQGNVKYLSSYHVGFAVVAFILLVCVGLFFPLVLIRRQWFRSIDNGLKKLLLDNLQRCFRDGFKWCAGFYFVCRFILLLIRLAVPTGALQLGLLNSVCCVSLAVFALSQPYTENGGHIIPFRILNISDVVLLCNLCLIGSFGEAVSGIYATRTYNKAFLVLISILSYLPLLFSLGLLVYILQHRLKKDNLILRDVE